MSDPVNLDNLREMIGGDADVEKELISVFITTSNECLESLQKSTAGDASEEWRAQAHAWKGMCLNLGAEPLGKICSEAQTNEALDEAGKKALLTQIEDEYSKVKTFLEAS